MSGEQSDETTPKVVYRREENEDVGHSEEGATGGSTEPKSLFPVQETGDPKGAHPIPDGLEQALRGAVGGLPDPTQPPVGDFDEPLKIPQENETAVESLPAYKEPQCLVDTAEGQLQVNQVVLSQIKDLSPDKQLVVVCIAGMYRTGKSYMMSRLAGHTRGFQLGSTIRSQTKGIWVWIRKHPLSKNKLLIFIDTEGLGDVERGDRNHDNHIFCLALLFSSVLVYNAFGVIDEDALDKISFITGMSKHMSTKDSGKEDDGDFDIYFPRFIFALRDFFLELVYEDEEISPDDYLDRALHTQTGRDDATKKHNEVRKCIMRYFPSRRCFTFDRPGNKKQLKSLETLTDADLNPEFVQDITKFREHILKTPVKRMMTGQPYNGRMWAEMVERFTSSICGGIIPCIESTIRNVSKAENDRLGKEGVAIYVSEMDKLPLPTDKIEILTDHHRKCFDLALKHFTDGAVFDSENKYNERMNEDIERLLRDYMKKNVDTSIERCHSVLKELSHDIDHKVESGFYIKPGGYIEYQKAINNLQEHYNEKSNLGIEMNNCWLAFLTNRKSEGETIMSADRTIDAQEKRRQSEERNAEIQRKQEEERKRREEKLANELEKERERAQLITVKEVGKKKAKVLEAMISNFETILTHRREVERKYRNDGCSEDADKVAEHIATMEQDVSELRQELQKQYSGCVIL